MRTLDKNKPGSPAAEWLRRLLVEDHCEWANRYVYWLKSPLGVLGLSAAASLLLGLFVAPQGFVLLTAILAVIVTGLVWPKLGVRGLTCEIAFGAPRAREGSPTPVEVRITNKWPFPVWGLSIEQGFFDAAPDEDRAAVALARINGWSQTTFRWDFTPELRGRYPKATPLLATAFPFGLWKARRAARVKGTIIAWPKTFWLPPCPMTGGRQAWTGEPSDAHAGSEGERIGVREHRHGDSLRLVHWAKTARHDRLIVSEREGAALRTAGLFVDTSVDSHRGSGAGSSLEWCLRIAASVAETLLAQGVRLDVQLGQDGGVFSASRSDLPKLMDWLAEHDPGEGEQSGATGSRRRGTGPATRLRIGTNRSEPVSGHATILLDADAFGDGANPPVADQQVDRWIFVDDPGGVADQVLRGWRRATKEARRGA